MTFEVKCVHVSNDGQSETATLVQPGADLAPFKVKVPIGTIGEGRVFHMWHSDARAYPAPEQSDPPATEPAPVEPVVEFTEEPAPVEPVTRSDRKSMPPSEDAGVDVGSPKSSD